LATLLESSQGRRPFGGRLPRRLGLQGPSARFGRSAVPAARRVSRRDRARWVAPRAVYRSVIRSKVESAPSPMQPRRAGVILAWIWTVFFNRP